MATKKQPLIINGPEFTTRAANFSRLMAVKEFQNRFFSNPSEVAAKEFGLKTSPSSASKANHMVYALLSDKKFNSWAKQFQKEVDASFPQIAKAKQLSDATSALKSKRDRQKLVEAFNASVASHLSVETASALEGINKGPLVSEGDVAVILLTFVVVVVVVTVAAGVATPGDLVSRIKLQSVVRQLTAAQSAQVRKQVR